MADNKKKDAYSCLADSLVEESLKEAADTFFGQRRSIESALQDFHSQVQKLLVIQGRVEMRLANLHFLLHRNDTATVEAFYRAVAVDPELIPRPEPQSAADLSALQIPRSIRAKARYQKLVLDAYAALVAEAADYMQGRYYKDPEDPRCMRVTINYRQLERQHEALRRQIRQANENNLPSQVLQYSKQFTGSESEKSGISVPVSYTLDREMAFTAPDFNQTGLRAYPELPSPDRVKGAVKSYSAKVFAEAPQEIRAILKAVKQKNWATP